MAQKRRTTDKLVKEDPKRKKNENITTTFDSNNILEYLLHPQTLSTFHSNFESKKWFIVNDRSAQSFTNFIEDSQEFRNHLSNASKKIFWTHFDINITNFPEETEEVSEDVCFYSDTNPVAYNVSEIWEKIESNESVDFLYVDEYVPRLRELLRNFDEQWKGEGGAVIHARITPPGVCPYGPYASEKDRFILQIEGEQSITMTKKSNTETAYPIDPYTDIYSTLFDIFIEGEIEEQVSLKAGNLLYIPASVAISANPVQESSFSLEIFFPPPASWTSLLNAILLQSHKQLAFKETVREINPDQPILMRTQNLLKNALQISDQVFDNYTIRTKLKKYHYDIDDHIQKYFQKESFIEKLNNNGGFLKIPNFLPDIVAKQIHQTLLTLTEDDWELSSSDDNLYTGDTSHNFFSSTNYPNAQLINRIFRSLHPALRSAFSAARYKSSHYISEHDDKNYQKISGQIFSRTIAIIYYLTPEWKEEYGGILTDLETNTNHIPQFNTLIAFKVPRRHLVSEVLSNERYSLFGWFLERGELYPLISGAEDGDEVEKGDDEENNEEDGNEENGNEENNEEENNDD